MFGYLDKYGPIKLDAIKFYLAELICGLEYMVNFKILNFSMVFVLFTEI